MNSKTNRLINESSPYLKQHAYNPVDWYPWGEEALARSVKEDKPILLSIGYSACHWCHVMEKESFENEEIAKIMNDYFINIKVDREERPDLDQLYMAFVQMTTGSGGWPMTVFLTPQQKPFFGGTYFPPENRYGRPGFKQVLNSVFRYYKDEKINLEKNLNQVEKAFNEIFQIEKKSDTLPYRSNLDAAVEKLTGYYEPVYGGIGHAPKFPAVQPLNLFLKQYWRDKDQNYLNMVTHTLRNMADGGIYDQLGGGFARYSVDEKWLVPHFEKMLYDNGQLIQLYTDVYLITHDEYFLRIACETADFVMHELADASGGFYSSLDADSEGIEGKFYVWDKNEVDKLLEEHSAIFCDYYDISEFGNFEGKNILHVDNSLKGIAEKFAKPLEEIKKIIEDGRKKLFQHREKRIRPALDDKIIASWNGLALSGLSALYRVTKSDKYKIAIEKNAKFVLSKMVKDNQLYRIYKEGKTKYAAFIEDYAFVAQGLFDASFALQNEEYLMKSKALVDYANKHFWDTDSGGYFTASDLQEKLFQRLKDENDQSIPSATGILLNLSLKLSALIDDPVYLERGETIFKAYAADMEKNPYGFCSYWNAFDSYLNGIMLIVVFYPENASIDKWKELLDNSYNPDAIVLLINEKKAAKNKLPAVLRGKRIKDNEITAFVCKNFSCSLPITDLQELAENIKPADF